MVLSPGPFVGHFMQTSSESMPGLRLTSTDESAHFADSVDHPCVFLPTVEQILDECKRIREGWSKAEQHRRRAGVTESDYIEHEVKAVV